MRVGLIDFDIFFNVMILNQFMNEYNNDNITMMNIFT